MIRLAVRCAPELADRVLAELVELAPEGVEEERGSDYVEYAIYGAPGELPALPELRAIAGDGLVEVTSAEVPEDWADRWQDFHKPVWIAGGRIVVRPSWEPRPEAGPAGAESGAQKEGPSRRRGQEILAQQAGLGPAREQPAGIDVVIDPGQAFGTGSHPTTRLCLELLLQLAEAGEERGALCDLGTGSGVLAIAAAKLGFDPVLACDHEETALEAAQANARANGVDLELRRVNLRTGPAPSAPTVLANLTGPVLREVARRLDHPPDRLICSGLLASEADEIADAFGAHGLGERERVVSGDWAALVLARP
ncbi:MAG TPA: 50S ribosomal protein L11 methyltransferase [Solirubrobacterales bacterium]|nr:50S ribosomal protein L11 methyltransferase [Solirubrobacterales bacterium]